MSDQDPSEWRLVGTTLTAAATDKILPVINSHFYYVLSDPGSGSVTIPLDSTAASAVTEGMLAVLYYRGAIRGSFLIENIRKVPASSQEGAGEVLSLSGRGGMSVLERAIIWSDGTTSTTRTFTNVTKGSILKTLIDEAVARNGLTGLTYDFTAVVDSDSVAWTDTEVYKLNVGMTLLELLRQFAKTGIDFEVNYSGTGFVLSAYKNGIGTDKTATEYFRTGTNCQEIDIDQRGNDIKNALLVAYKAGDIVLTDSASITTNGRREELLDARVAQTASSATTYGAAILETKKDAKIGRTIRVYDGIPPYLFVDYIVGDTISLDIEGTVTEDRILGVQCDFDGEYSNVVIELNSLMLEDNIKLRQDVDKLLNDFSTARDADLLEVSYWASLGNPAIGTVADTHVIGSTLFVIDTTTLWMYDIVAGTWSSQAIGNQPICLDSIGTDLYIGGFSSVYKYVPSTNTLTEIGVVSFSIPEIQQVCDMAVIGTNLYCSGVYNTIDGVAIAGYAKYNSLTDIWSNIGGDVTLGYNFMISIGSNLYTHYANQIDKWDGASWSQVGVFPTTGVQTMKAYGTNILVSATGGLYEWDGATWAAFGGSVTGAINDIAVYLTDVYICGTFTDVGNRIAKYSGGYWSELETGLDNTGLRIEIYDTDIYVAGSFTTAGGKDAVKVAVYFTNFESLIEHLENSGRFDMGSAIHNAPASAITDTDEMGFWEATAAKLRKITWANIKATLKTYFDTLYVALTGNQTVAGVKSFSSVIVSGNHASSLGGEGDLEMFAPTGANPAIIQHAFGGVIGFVGMTTDGTEASKSAVPSGKVLYNVAPYAYDGVGYYADAHLKNVAAEAHDATHHGTKWELWATPVASTTEILIATFYSNKIDLPTNSTYDINGSPHTHDNFTTTVTAAGVTTLTATSTNVQEFTGTSNQDVLMPVVSTLVLGRTFIIINNSTGNIIINSSGGDQIVILSTNTRIEITCVAITGTGVASWDIGSYLARDINAAAAASLADADKFGWYQTASGLLKSITWANIKVALDLLYAPIAHSNATSNVHGLPANAYVLGNKAAAGEFTQRGWGFVTGDGTNLYARKTVTFPVAFTTLTALSISVIGFKLNSDPTTILDFSLVGGVLGFSLGSQSLSGFTANIAQMPSDGAIPTTVRYGFSWIAIGT